jgi:hypothetical protein
MQTSNKASAHRSRARNNPGVSPPTGVEPDKSAPPKRLKRTSSPPGLAGNKKSPRGSRQSEFRFFLDHRGRQHFNFRQCVWLDCSVPMAFSRVYTTALKTLAVNLLTFATDRRDYSAAAGVTSRLALSLASAFSRECLMSAPDGAWALPKATIKAWLESRIRRRNRRSR